MLPRIYSYFSHRQKKETCEVSIQPTLAIVCDTCLLSITHGLAADLLCVQDELKPIE